MSYIGPNNRRNFVPLSFRPSSSSSPNTEYNYHIPDTHYIRTSTCTPLLRVPHHAPSYTPHWRGPADTTSTLLYYTIRRLCHILIPTDWKFTGCHSGSRILQLDGLPSLLGKSDCGPDGYRTRFGWNEEEWGFQAEWWYRAGNTVVIHLLHSASHGSYRLVAFLVAIDGEWLSVDEVLGAVEKGIA